MDQIEIPMCFLNALDDPIVPIELQEIPKEVVKKSKNAMQVTTKFGGHLGFYEGIPLIYVLPGLSVIHRLVWVMRRNPSTWSVYGHLDKDLREKAILSSKKNPSKVLVRLQNKQVSLV